MMLHNKRLSRDENIFYLLQQLRPKAGDGDLLCWHEGSEDRIYATRRVRQTLERH